MINIRYTTKGFVIDKNYRIRIKLGKSD
jgi:hypothetical protein